MLMVMAGNVVDIFINQLVPLLEPGDIIIDGGNSHFPDTNRRTKELESKGIYKKTLLRLSFWSHT